MVSKAKIQKILSHWDLPNRTVKPIISENTGRQNENAYYVGDDYIIKYTTNLAAVQKPYCLMKWSNCIIRTLIYNWANFILW